MSKAKLKALRSLAELTEMKGATHVSVSGVTDKGIPLFSCYVEGEDAPFLKRVFAGLTTPKDEKDDQW